MNDYKETHFRYLIHTKQNLAQTLVAREKSYYYFKTFT